MLPPSIIRDNSLSHSIAPELALTNRVSERSNSVADLSLSKAGFQCPAYQLPTSRWMTAAPVPDIDLVRLPLLQSIRRWVDDRSREISFTQSNEASRLANAPQLDDGFDRFWDVREDLAGVDDVEVAVVVRQGGHIGDFERAVGGQIRLCSSSVDGCLDGIDSDDVATGNESCE